MTSTDTQKIVSQLRADSIADQVAALDERVAGSGSFEPNEKMVIADAALDALSRSSNRYILAEKIIQLGEELIQPAVRRFGQYADPELNFYLAALLLLKGERIGVPTLLSEVRADGEFLVFACNLLANAKVKELSPRLINVLSEIPLGEDTPIPTEQHDVVCTLLRCLAKVVSRFPGDLFARFTDSRTPNVIRNTVCQLWLEL